MPASAAGSERGEDGYHDKNTGRRCARTFGPESVPLARIVCGVSPDRFLRNTFQADFPRQGDRDFRAAETDRRASVPGFPLGHRRAQHEALVCGPARGTAASVHCGVRTPGNFGRIIRSEEASAILERAPADAGGLPRIAHRRGRLRIARPEGHPIGQRACTQGFSPIRIRAAK